VETEEDRSGLSMGRCSVAIEEDGMWSNCFGPPCGGRLAWGWTPTWGDMTHKDGGAQGCCAGRAHRGPAY
jgi:hypothetical protein